jgi:hypothetical protein
VALLPGCSSMDNGVELTGDSKGCIDHSCAPNGSTGECGERLAARAGHKLLDEAQPLPSGGVQVHYDNDVPPMSAGATA